MLAVVFANNNAGREQSFGGFCCRSEFVENFAPAIGGVANAVSTDRSLVEAAILNVRRGALVLGKTGLPVLFKAGVERKQFIVTTCRLITFVSGHFDAHRAGEGFDRVDETHVIVFHQKPDRGAVSAATEAMVKALNGAYGE